MLYKEIIKKLNKNSLYTRKQLYEVLHNEKPNLSYNSLKWIVSNMEKNSLIVRKQRGLYSLKINDKSSKQEYVPKLDKHSNNICALITKKFPLVNFVCFESRQLNEFLNQLIAKNTYFIIVEKKASEAVFRYLQEQNIDNVLLRPNEKEFDAYWKSECIIVLNLISEFPKNKNSNHCISLEQLLVDLVSEKCFDYLYSKSEISNIYSNAYKIYKIDTVRLLRYARRRGKEKEIREILEVL